MSDALIFHNPRCSKSRQALSLLEAAGVTPTIVRYLEAPPTASELDRLLELLGMEPQQLMRTSEERYLELGLDRKQLSRTEAIRTLVENPILIERPIIVIGDRAIVGRPPDRVNDLLG